MKKREQGVLFPFNQGEALANQAKKSKKGTPGEKNFCALKTIAEVGSRGKGKKPLFNSSKKGGILAAIFLLPTNKRKIQQKREREKKKEKRQEKAPVFFSYRFQVMTEERREKTEKGALYTTLYLIHCTKKERVRCAERPPFLIDPSNGDRDEWNN